MNLNDPNLFPNFWLQFHNKLDFEMIVNCSLSLLVDLTLQGWANQVMPRKKKYLFTRQ